MKKRIWLAALFGLLMSLAGCSTPQKTGVSVVSTVDFYGEMAKAVVGRYGTATSVISDPAVDPHDYEPTTAVGKAVATADIVVENGAGYDSWMPKLVAANGNRAKVVSAAKVVGVKPGENEHIWYKPSAVPAMADALAKQLGKLDPVHKAQYLANAAAYNKRLKPISTLVMKLRHGSHNARVAVSEPVFNNALTAMGYRISNEHFAQAIEEGTDPSPEDIRQLRADFTAHRVQFFVVNTQVQSNIIASLVKAAEAADIPIVRVTETLPAKHTYTSWMLQQYQAVARVQAAQQ
ncbi:metal ABC transporter solute-binding protein, Zn/Mn family [Lacticaseibacillus nasuensis]|uniref:ABC transporter substrate-binding protein n=1 Tax=Lacticaseibacillus nasuensis JCM 17158 TaxID=1291734 RepID=A0A0R1JQL1_9LACO|nr:zinc ABC transporter substrate-binding protein [Lacticaseibacillus nasuensis]KRK70481.1 ABC transporter substrate-binding protein [Lacticaseibacillus nasuensis JCM 17158]